MRQLAVISKLTGVSTNLETSEVTISHPSIVKLSVSREEISQMTRVNQDLVITLRSGEAITVKNFYVTNDQGASQLVLEEGNGTLWWVENPGTSLHSEQITSINDLLVASGGSHEGGAIWPWVLGGVVAAGGIAAVASSGGGGGHHDNHNGSGNGNPGVSTPGGTDPGGTDPGGTDPGGTDPGGNNPGKDTTPPTAPGALAVSPDGKTLTGLAEPGSNVIIKDAQGNVIGQGKAGSDGKFTIDLNAPKLSGEHLTATATDAAGNVGPSAGVNAPNIPLPRAPVFTDAVDDHAPATGTVANNQFTNDNTPTLQGTGSPGSLIHIYVDGKETGTVLVGLNGKWSYAITTALTDGAHSFTAIATNIKGSSSESTHFILHVDTQAPQAPELDAFTDKTGSITGPLINNERTDEARPTLSGIGEAGNIITIRDGTTILGTTVVDSSGHWSFTPTAALSDGSHTFTIQQTDKAGNVSGLTTTPTIVVDTTPPAAAVVDSVSKDGTTVTGHAEAGSTVSIYDADNNFLGSAVAAEDGTFSITLNPAKTHGEALEAHIHDVAGNNGPAYEFTASNSQFPAQPVIITVSDDVGTVTGVLKNGQATDDNRPTISGTAEPGSIITINDNGVPMPTLPPVIADGDGKWSFTPSLPLPDGDHLFTATATNNFGTSGQSISFAVDIDTQPPVLEDLEVINQGATLTGSTEAGSTVVIKDSQGNVLGSGQAGSDGTFAITIAPAKTNGETLTISVTDKASNSGPVESLKVPDITPPASPSGLVVAADGESVSGQAEPGSTVTIKDATGNVLGTGVANAGGQFIVPLTSPQTNGEALTATAKDAAQNVSQPSTVLAPDTTAPLAPDDVTVSPDGSSVTGTAEPGSTITITAPDGSTIGTGKTGGDGHFTVPVSPAQTNGETVSVTATDNAKNVSPPQTAVAPDTTAPDKPVISQVLDDVEGDTGPLTSGQTTNDNRPTLSGTAEAGSSVEIFDNGQSLGFAVMQPNGSWSFTPQTGLGEGKHQLTAVATDAKGNASPAAAFELVVDTQSPQMPAITHVTDDMPAIVGSVANNGLTNDSTPTLNGTGEPGSIVHLMRDGQPVVDITVDNTGTWSYTLPQALADDTYEFTVTASDSNGNTTSASAGFTITIDTTPPGAPAFFGALDADDNPIDNNQSTNTSQPQLTGSGTTGDIITLYDNGKPIGETTVGADGTWEFTPPAALGDGKHILTATASDGAGNEGSESNSFTLLVDTNAPNAPQILSATIVVGTDNVVLANGSTTNQETPLLSGTGEPGATIAIYNNGVELDTVQVNSQGKWTWQPANDLAEGLNVLTATATDAAGNVSPVSGVYSITIDTVPPAQPDAPLVTDNVAPVVGNVASGGATNDTTPTFSGTGEVGSTIIIYNNNVEIGRTTVGDNGAWSFTPDALTPDTTYVITTTETDIAGNISQPSDPVTLTIDTTAPTDPTIGFATDDDSNPTSNFNSGATTDDSTPVIHGTGEIGSIITLFNGSTILGQVTVDGTGNWTLPVTSPLSDGTWTLTAVAKDAAGNTSGTSNTFTFTVDTVPLQPPVVTEILDNVTPVTGTLVDGSFTNDQTLTISGTGESGSTVTIYDNGTATGTAVVIDGKWTFTTPVLSEDSHALTFSAEDGAGNTTAQTPAINITVDITPPPAPTIQVVAEDGTRVSGLADPLATVEIRNASGTVVGTATANNSGEFSVTLSPAQTNGGELTATATDRAGNVGAGATFDASDSGLPDVPVISAIDDNIGSVQGNILTAGGRTDDTTPTLRGTTEVGSTVEVFINGVSAGQATVDASGNWIFAVTTPLGEATYNFTVQATNASGTGGLSAPVTVTVDLTAPLQPAITSATDDVPGLTGTLANGALTNDRQPTLNGTGEAGATITLFDNGNQLGTTTVDQNGNWSFTPGSNLSSSQHVFTATATDSAGNTGAVSGNFTLTIDAIAPNVPLITSVIDDNNLPNVSVLPGQTTDDRQPVLNGTGEAGATINVFDNGVLLGTAVVGDGGTWSYTVTSNLSEGSHNLTVSATDPAGNTSAASSAWNIIVDITPPAVPTLTSVVDDQPGITGNLVSGQLTNDATPTLNGRGEAGATINIWLDGGTTPIGTAIVDGTGAWSFTPGTPLPDGNHTLTLSATDPAGNTSALSGGFTVNIDATAPVAPVITSVADNTAPVIGVVPNGGSTNETRPTITGSGEAGSTISIYNGSTLVGTTLVQAGGTWSFTPATPLAAGSWNLTATATDTAGNTGPASDVRSFTIDTTAPVAPAVTTVFDDKGPITGNLSSGQITDDTRPTLSGTSEPNATIRIFDNGTLLSEFSANGSGNWSYTPTADLATGNHVITVTAVDAAGNVSPPSNSFTFVVDTTAPLVPVITLVTDDVAPGTGALTNGQSTNDPTPTFSGTGEAGATITLYENGTALGTTMVLANGTWSVATSTLGSGTHTITAVATDAAGNASAATGGFTLTVDTTTPVAPVLTTVVDDIAGGVVGNLTSGQVTNDSRPTLSGSAEAGSTVSIYDGGSLLGTTTVGAGGAWSFTPGSALSDGSHTLTVTATDAAGNISPATGGFVVVVDTTAPLVPVIVSIIDDVPNITGAVGNGQSTNDTLPTLNGTAEANSTVNIFDNGTLVASVTANASGSWTWTPTAALGQGTHAYTVTSADAAGNVSATSPASSIVVDTLAPAAPTGLAINATGNRVTGTAEAGSTVTITSGTGTVLGTATADGAGNFVVTLSPAQTSGQALLAFAQDKAGNTGVSAGFTAPDTRVPDAPTIVNVVDDVGIYTGIIANGQVTNDALPTLNGTAQANATIAIYNNGTLLGTTTANASGAWSFTPGSNLTEGTHAFTATATNANGTGAASTAATVVVDTLAPNTPSGTLSADGGSLTGLAEANSTVTVTIPGGGTYTTTAGSNGVWSLTLPTKQIEGQQLGVTSTDAAGNTSGSLAITAPTLPLSANDNVTSLALTTTATTSTQNYSDYGLLLVGALGNVASVLGSDIAQVQFTIANGGSGNVTIDAAATGIVLSLLSTQEIVVQRFDTTLGTWTTIVNTSVGDFANLLTLNGSGVSLNLTGLTGGQYRVLTYNTSLLATGSYTSLDVDVHQTSAGVISGPTVNTGNVMADDTTPTGTSVTSVTNANGQTTTVGAGGVDIAGQYGTLHLNQDGSYTYTLTNTSAAVYGQKESFTYTITQGSNSSSAHLVINLGPAPAASTVVAADNNAAVVFDTSVGYVNNGPSVQNGLTVLSVGVGNVLNANLLDDMANPIIFDVEEGSTRTLTLQGAVGGVTLASTFDLYIYRFNDTIQQYEQYRVQKGWINTLLLNGSSQPLTITLPGGEYLFVLNTASGISALTGYTLNISQDHTYVVDSTTANTSGNVLTNDIAPADAAIVEVNGVAVSSTGSTTINGLYGTLSIDAKGNYTYTLKNGVGADSIKTPDSFIYTVRASNGDTDTASLNITPTPQALNAVDDLSSIMVINTVQDSAAFGSGALGTATIPTLGNKASSSGSFDVATNDVLKSATLNFNIGTVITVGTLGVTWTITGPNGFSLSGSVPASSISLLGSSIAVSLGNAELTAGHYTVNFTGTMGGLAVGDVTITPNVTGTTWHLNTWDVNTATVNGNIFDGSDAAGAHDQLSTVHTLLTVNGYNGSTATLNPTGSTSSATIQGHYGALTMNLDGSYTYTLKPGTTVASMTTKETFTYTLNDQNGHTDTATLTINMNPQLASSSQHDVITGSAYGDTLIYHLLNANNATGGNNSDNWTNFSTAQGDKIDIHELLTGWNHQASTLGSYVQVTTSGANTIISVDRDGTGGTYQSTNLVTLENVNTTLNELVQNNHLITGG
ncbi:Ig-like domain repeat protein [Citrobacter amalonaticus]|uniref:Ig-like domain repeat protein n=1 Tax=Citrobacter amalonaticus TaxID=35703 RepID=A0A2S4RQI0_CITAM|nr:BapA/Bap/LapF family large adhesin [Citrobacter amalonaticus]POT56297.1 Ig-like domain repeat protein [Citrobacter amalonaticus]POT74821.1 Ig-like domain repeat protein [Citrobacter amalonaticus]POU60070.1 Ig-like domain repeat protein [Citrobacter amalonaticus]POV02481.1 Ig-like domain repeat protein [Citrobacter amalonaticus]